MIKKITVKGHSALAKEVIKYEKLGYFTTYKVDGKEYTLRKGIRQIVRIVRE